MAYIGGSGKPFSTSCVDLRPNAGRELMLKSLAFTEVNLFIVFGSMVVSMRMGYPMLRSGWRLSSFLIVHYCNLRAAVKVEIVYKSEFYFRGEAAIEMKCCIDPWGVR